MFERLEEVDLNDKQYWYESRMEGGLVQPEPFDYMKLFEPKSAAEMQQILTMRGSESNNSGYSSGGQDSAQGGGDDDETY
jgi:hypothetical protein